jgi:hypothetical protein
MQQVTSAGAKWQVGGLAVAAFEAGAAFAGAGGIPMLDHGFLLKMSAARNALSMTAGSVADAGK